MGHGDHWRAVLGETGGTVQLIRKILEDGMTAEVSDEQKTFYDANRQETVFLGIKYGIDPVCGLAIVEREPDAKQYTLTTAYPYFIGGAAQVMEITAIDEDAEHCEAIVTAIKRDGTELSFYEPLYFKNKFILSTGNKYEFSMAAVAYSLEKLENTELVITEGPTLEMERERTLEKDPCADVTKINSVTFDLSNMRSLLPHNDEPGDAEFQTVVEDVEYFDFENIEICRMAVMFNLGDDRNVGIYLYASQHVLKDYRPKTGDPIQGMLWLQGCAVKQINDPESWADLDREDSTIARLQKAFAVEEYLSGLPIGVKALGSSIAYSGLEMNIYGNYGQEPDIPAFLVSRDEVEINVWVRSYIDGQEPAVSFSEEEVNNYLESSAKRNQKGACVVVVCKDIGSGYTFRIEGIEKLEDLTGKIIMIDYKRKDEKGA